MTPESKLLADPDTEKAVLGCMMRANRVIADVVLILAPMDFSDGPHGSLYALICKLHDGSMVVDAVTVSAAMEGLDWADQIGGKVGLLSILESGYLPGSAKTYATLIKESSIRRKLLNHADTIREIVLGRDTINDTVDKIQSMLMGIGMERSIGDLKSIEEFGKEAFEYMADIVDNGVRPGIVTGIRKLDRITGGFQRGDLVVVAARPSVGKTAFAVQIAIEAIKKNNVAVLMFSLEMAGEKIFMRMLSYESEIDMHSIMTVELDDEDAASVKIAGEKTMNLPMWIDQSADLSVMSIRVKSRKKRMEIQSANSGSAGGPQLGLIIVDYLQLITADTGRLESRAQEVSEISRQLKSLARELDLPVVALSQLNREVEKRLGGKPILSDIRESGSVEQDADIVLLLNRPGLTSSDDTKKEAGEIIVAKHRNGPTGTIDIKFIPMLGQFYENEKS